jgi:hypothetical protein
MNYRFIEEPDLQFNRGRFLCPRAGILKYDAYDCTSPARRKEIYLGAVGTNEDVELLSEWIIHCSTTIEAGPDIRQKNLSPNFMGFNDTIGFKAKMVLPDEFKKRLNKKDLNDLLKITNRIERIESVVDFYHNAISFLGLNKKPDVIVCVIPPSFDDTIIKRSKKEIEETIEEKEDDQEIDFRRALKAKCMYLGIPLQLLREHTITHTKGLQDHAVRAWNFCTALYYKANGTPWRLVSDPNLPQTCFVGVGFYRSRDRRTIQTSMAQIFDELGNGVILRGETVEKNKEDRQPHLSAEQSYDLLHRALDEYKTAMDNFPGRLVLHKTSKFSNEELDGFSEAIGDLRIGTYDFVTILDATIRAYRNGAYPPFRGTQIRLGEERCLFYTRGSVEFYETYPGMYVPNPLDIRLEEGNQSLNAICEEILALTKMNWNNTQFDGKYPITISCARKVGQIMKYVPESENPQTRYSFYM